MTSISTGRWAITIILLAGTAAPAAAQIPAETIVDALCRKDQHKTLTRLGRDSLNELVKCHKQRMTGRIAAATDCNDLANAPSALRIAREQDKVTRRIQTSCAGDRRPAASEPAALGYDSCNAPCDAVAIDNSWEGQTDCVICLADAETEILSTAVFGTPALPLSRSAERCQNKVGAAIKAYFGKRTGIQARCQTAKDLGDISLDTDCKADDDRGRMVRARTALSRAISRCSDADFAELDGCGANVAGAQTCLRSAVESASDALFDAVYPPIPGPPTPTATASATPEVTATPTVTPDPCIGIDCPGESACLFASTCAGGNCSPQPPKQNGTACSDGNTSGTCQNGTCTDPCFNVSCPGETACLFASTCSGGNCSSPASKPNGTSCVTDGNASGSCTQGVCTADDGNNSNSSTVIRVFPTGGSYKGHTIGGRNASSLICNQSGYSNSSCSGGAVALLSYGGDTVRNLGSSFPAGTSVVAATGVVLANDWSDFTDGSWQNDVQAAFGNRSFWTGSKSDGALSANCQDWTNGSVVGAYTTGNASSFFTGTTSCATLQDLLCACASGDSGNATSVPCSVDFNCTNATTANLCNSPPNSQYCEWKSQISRCVLKPGNSGPSADCACFDANTCSNGVCQGTPLSGSPCTLPGNASGVCDAGVCVEQN